MKNWRAVFLPLLALCAVALQGCVEMAVVGAGAAVMSAVDRRTPIFVDDNGGTTAEKGIACPFLTTLNGL